MRLPIYSNGTSQVRRYTWGSVEQFAAALVANLPTLYGLRKWKCVEQKVNSDGSKSHKLSQRAVGHTWTSEQQLLDYSHFVAESWRGSCGNDSIEEGDNVWSAPNTTH